MTDSRSPFSFVISGPPIDTAGRRPVLLMKKGGPVSKPEEVKGAIDRQLEQHGITVAIVIARPGRPGEVIRTRFGEHQYQFLMKWRGAARAAAWTSGPPPSPHMGHQGPADHRAGGFRIMIPADDSAVRQGVYRISSLKPFLDGIGHWYPSGPFDPRISHRR